MIAKRTGARRFESTETAAEGVCVLWGILRASRPMIDHLSPPLPCLPAGQPCAQPRWSLIVAVLGSSMAFVDGTVVNVALPVIQRGLGAGVDQAQWIVEAYSLLLASLVLLGGALGDRLGRRRVFVAGVALFALASAACGLAPSAATLIGARAVQGVGG